MKDILYRGRKIDNGKWIEGYYAIIGKRKVIIALPEMYYDDNGKECYGNEIKDVVPETVCQYTGIKDKDGRKIFEGDIVFIDAIDEYVVIEWEDDTARFTMSSKTFTVNFDNYWGYEVEIIGNIFDNPELLDEETLNE